MRQIKDIEKAYELTKIIKTKCREENDKMLTAYHLGIQEALEFVMDINDSRLIKDLETELERLEKGE